MFVALVAEDSGDGKGSCELAVPYYKVKNLLLELLGHGLMKRKVVHEI